jgi:hypothetical protein
MQGANADNEGHDWSQPPDHVHSNVFVREVSKAPQCD